MRRSLPLVLAGVAALASTSMLVPTLASSAGAAESGTTQIFPFTGASALYVVPANVCGVLVTVDGASGGSAPTLADLPGVVAGGVGGEATAFLPVTPGEALEV